MTIFAEKSKNLHNYIIFQVHGMHIPETTIEQFVHVLGFKAKNMFYA